MGLDWLGMFLLAIPVTFGLLKVIPFYVKGFTVTWRIRVMTFLALVIVWSITFWRFESWWLRSLIGLAFMVYLILLLVDAYEMILPDILNGIVFILGMVMLFSPHRIQGGETIISSIDQLIGLLIGVFFLVLVEVVYRLRNKWIMGGGDIKLIGATGLLIGWQLVLLGIAFSAFIALPWLVVTKRFSAEKRTQALPYGPFLILGFMLATWAGLDLVSWYLDLIFT